MIQYRALKFTCTRCTSRRVHIGIHPITSDFIYQCANCREVDITQLRVAYELITDQEILTDGVQWQ